MRYTWDPGDLDECDSVGPRIPTWWFSFSNHSAATRIEVAGAKSEASRLLSVVGIKIRWVDCGRK